MYVAEIFSTYLKRIQRQILFAKVLQRNQCTPPKLRDPIAIPQLKLSRRTVTDDKLHSVVEHQDWDENMKFRKKKQSKFYPPKTNNIMFTAESKKTLFRKNTFHRCEFEKELSHSGVLD